MEPVCEAGQGLIAGHLQVQVHNIRGVEVGELSVELQVVLAVLSATVKAVNAHKT